MTKAKWIEVLIGTISHMTGINLNLDSQQLANLAEQDQLNLLKDKMAEANMVPANAPIGQIKGLLDVFIANAQLHYVAGGQQHPVAITLYRAKEFNPHYDYSVYDDENCDKASSTLGWSRYAIQSNVQLVEGDHITMLSPDYADKLASQLMR